MGNNKNVEMKVGGKFNTLPIREFSFDMFEYCPTIVLIAKRASGKSWVVKALLSHFRDVPVGVIIAPTDKKSQFFGSFFPETYIYYEFTSDIIIQLLERQDRMIEKEQAKKLKGKKFDSRAFLVMDD